MRNPLWFGLGTALTASFAAAQGDSHIYTVPSDSVHDTLGRSLDVIGDLDGDGVADVVAGQVGSDWDLSGVAVFSGGLLIFIQGISREGTYLHQ